MADCSTALSTLSRLVNSRCCPALPLLCSTPQFYETQEILDKTTESVVMSASAFEEQGIQFKVISPEMYGDVLDFLWAHFFPEEPLLRSMGITRGPLVTPIDLRSGSSGKK